MTMKNLLKAIVASFKKEYGFAPSMKAITPMESSGSGNNYDWLAFCVNGIGYDFHIGGKVYRNENYDL